VRIGLISDTHGRLDEPLVARLFDGVDHIVHAGDVGSLAVIAALERIAPVTAVFGNIDRGEVLERLPRVATGEVEAGGGAAQLRFAAAHKKQWLRDEIPDPAAAGYDLVVYGHTHEPAMRWRDGVLWVNPGTVTAPEPDDRQRTVALAELEDGRLNARIVFVTP
jgi:uncharacterized protein